MMNRLKQLYYSSWLGGKHLEVLLWLDYRKSRKNYKLTPSEVQQVIRKYSLLNQGVIEMKYSINNLLKSRTKEEYDNLFREVDNLIEFAQESKDSEKAKAIEFVRTAAVKKNKDGIEQDVITATDHAKMIEKKIEHVKEWQEHTKKRNMLREVRKLKAAGLNEEADKLFKEWQVLYGSARTNNRRT